MFSRVCVGLSFLVGENGDLCCRVAFGAEDISRRTIWRFHPMAPLDGNFFIYAKTSRITGVIKLIKWDPFFREGS